MRVRVAARAADAQKRAVRKLGGFAAVNSGDHWGAVAQRLGIESSDPCMQVLLRAGFELVERAEQQHAAAAAAAVDDTAAHDDASARTTSA